MMTLLTQLLLVLWCVCVGRASESNNAEAASSKDTATRSRFLRPVLPTTSVVYDN